jgi:predicted TPR repeat methyltransferase
MNRKQRRALSGVVRSDAPASEAQRVEQAIALHRRGQLDAAEALYRQILRRNPRQVDALHFLGVLAAQRHDNDGAVKLIRQALELNPRYADAHNNLGNVLAAMERFDEAATAYRQAIELAPGNFGAHCNLGIMLRRSGRFEEAVAACQQVLALNPRLAEVHLNLGKALVALERHEEAMAAFREAIRLRPGHASAYKSLGMLLYRLNRSEEAAELFRGWLEQDPANPVARHLLAAHSGHAAPARAADDYVKELFDGMADSFDDHLHRLDYRAPDLIAREIGTALGTPTQSLEVLDAGCGTGLCGPLLRPYARRLIGVDLSPRMVERARTRGDYDELAVAELTAFLAARPVFHDLIVSADTLVYFGDLRPVLAAAAAALRPEGWLAFTVERGEEGGTEEFRLDRSGRYQHAEAYLRRELVQAGMMVETLETVELRLEGGHPVVGFLVLARKPWPAARAEA